MTSTPWVPPAKVLEAERSGSPRSSKSTVGSSRCPTAVPDETLRTEIAVIALVDLASDLATYLCCCGRSIPTSSLPCAASRTNSSSAGRANRRRRSSRRSLQSYALAGCRQRSGAWKGSS
jgi:hypothetical protein